MTELALLQETFVWLIGPVVALQLAVFVAVVILLSVLLGIFRTKPIDVHIVSRDDE